MIYLVSWIPSAMLFGALVLFLIVPVIAMAVVLAAVVLALIAVAALAAALAAAPVLAVRAARLCWPQLVRSGREAAEPALGSVALANPRLHRVP